MKKYSKEIKSSLSFLGNFKLAQNNEERYESLIKEDIESDIESLVKRSVFK